MSTSTGADLRTDELTGVRTFVVDSRQDRPNLPAVGCPFCPGGLEAPEEYDVRWFRNRWPAMPDDRCEVVLYTPLHDATFWSLGVKGARKVLDLWSERTAALGARDDVDYVLVFENRGAAVGATIVHPHGQISAFEFVPELPRRELLRGTALGEPGDRLVAESPGWRAWVPEASVFPYAVRLAPDDLVPDLPSLSDAGRDALAGLLIDVLQRLDRLFDAETPYMLWIHQRPFDGSDWPDARLHIEIVTPWRAPDVTRYVAAGELGSGVYFNPVAPAAAAQSLRDAV
jgi:UDPglucose--hexose-1-phosphate uridylyltransferase